MPDGRCQDEQHMTWTLGPTASREANPCRLAAGIKSRTVNIEALNGGREHLRSSELGFSNANN